MKTVILAAAALYVVSLSAAWALPKGDNTEAWIGNEYDHWWNQHRSDLLQHWKRYSYEPDDSSRCLAVGRVWYCPATNTLAQQN